MKKRALILGAVGAAILLAGGVVAAYVITDNANKQGIHITPGSIEDAKTESITLEWGDMAEFTDIEGLKAGTPVTRSVAIKATTEDEEGVVQDNAVYQGQLDVELKDLSGKSASAVKLIDYLSVSVKGYAYSSGAFAAEKSVLGTLDADHLTAELPVFADKGGKQVDLVVSLDASAQPVMAQIMADQVYLSVDWNRAANDANAVKHVFIPDNGWSSMYVYSYADGVQNAEWPGVQLQRDPVTGLFEADLLDHDYFIFTEAADATDHRYPADGQDGMTKADLNYNSAAAIYFDWAQHTFVADAPVTLAPFYLLGEETAWDVQADYAFALEDKEGEVGSNYQHQWKLEAEVVTGKDYKFRSGDGNIWLGYAAIEEGCRALVTGEDNFQFAAAGTYEFYLKLNLDSSYSVFIAAKA